MGYPYRVSHGIEVELAAQGPACDFSGLSAHIRGA